MQKTSWLSFQYEKIPIFCYVCGKLGHMFKECEAEGKGTEGRKEEEMPYGSYLRAGAKINSYRGNDQKGNRVEPCQYLGRKGRLEGGEETRGNERMWIDEEGGSKGRGKEEKEQRKWRHQGTILRDISNRMDKMGEREEGGKEEDWPGEKGNGKGGDGNSNEGGECDRRKGGREEGGSQIGDWQRGEGKEEAGRGRVWGKNIEDERGKEERDEEEERSRGGAIKTTEEEGVQGEKSVCPTGGGRRGEVREEGRQGTKKRKEMGGIREEELEQEHTLKRRRKMISEEEGTSMEVVAERGSQPHLR